MATHRGVLRFSALEGSSEDVDGEADGVWTVSRDIVLEGQLVCDVSGTDSRNDAREDCEMEVHVAGDLVLRPGAGISAGLGLRLHVAGDFVLEPGAFVVSDRGSVELSAGGQVRIDGLVSGAGTDSVLSASSVATPGKSPASVILESTGGTGNGIWVGASGTVLSIGRNKTDNRVEISGCGLEIRGLIAVVESGPGASVVMRSCDELVVGGADLADPNGARRGRIEVQGAGTARVDLFARDSVRLDGAELRIAGGERNNIAVTSDHGSVSWRQGVGEVDVAGGIHLSACAGVELEGSRIDPRVEIREACGGVSEREAGSELASLPSSLSAQGLGGDVGVLGSPDPFGSCTPSLAVDNMTIATTEEFISCDVLTSANTNITPSGFVTYRAREAIVLENGFSADGGATFLAILDSTVNSPPLLATGALEFVEAEFDGVGGVDGLYGAWSATVSPDGKHVYATGRLESALAVFSRDAATGALAFVEAQKDGVGGVEGLGFPYSVAVSPDGNNVFAAGSALVVFSRNETSGALTFVEAEDDDLGSVSSVAVTPDGRHVYATSSVDDAVAAFSRDAATGAVTFLEVKNDGVGGVDGLGGASDVVVSPDGQHVYVAGFFDNAVAVFLRDVVTGALTFVEAQKDGEGGVEGLDFVYSVAVSPDSQHVYAVGHGENAVAVFSRDANTGALTFLEIQKDGVGGVDGLFGARSAIVTPDGMHVYVAGEFDNAVAVFSRNTTTGALTFVAVHNDGVAGVDGLGRPTTVTVSPDGKHVYAAGSNDHAVVVFSRQGSSVTFIAGGEPLPIFSATTDFNVADVDGTTLASATVAIANVQDGAMEVLAATPSGAIAAPDITYVEPTLTIAPAVPAPLADFQAVLRSLSYVNTDKVAPNNTTRNVTIVADDGAASSNLSNTFSISITYVNLPPEIISDGGGATATVIAPETLIAVTDVQSTDPDGETEGAGLTYSVLGGADAPRFSIAPTTGVLSFNSSPDFDVPGDANMDNDYEVAVKVTDAGGLIDVQDITVTVTSNKDAPVITSDGGGSTAAVSAIENQTAATDVQSSDADGETEGGGGLTYSVTGGADQSLFSIDPDTGELTFNINPDFENPLDSDADNDFVVDITVADTGALTDTQTVTVTVTDINEAPILATGSLQFIEFQQDGVAGVDGLDEALSVTVSPDGEHVYAAGYNDDAVAVFSRSAATGALTFVEAERDQGIPRPGLDGAAWVTVSPDGKHVYVAAALNDAIGVYSRNAITGALTLITIAENHFVGARLESPLEIAIAPDGKHLYVATYGSHGVVVFSRNMAAGTLSFVQFLQRYGGGGVEGLGGVNSVSVSPDGKHVYTAGSQDNAVVVFARDATTGALTPVEFQQDGAGGVDGLDGANSVTVSPDGKHVYAAGVSDDAVVVFARDATAGTLTFVEFRQDGVDGVDGLDGVLSVKVSPDGKHVYAASIGDDAVAAFLRDPITGEFAFVDSQKDGMGGVDGLDGANSVTVSPDGKHVYAAGRYDDSLTVFSRQNRSVPFVAGRGPVSLLDAAVADVDDVNLVSATATITNLMDAPNEVLAANTAGTSIAAAYTPATGVLSMTGSDTLADYEQVLSTLTYDNLLMADTVTRLIEVVVNDGGLDSNTFAVMVWLFNAPEITSDGGGASAAVNAAENQTAVTDVQSTDTDGDSEGDGLTYSISDGADQLLFSIEPNTGVLTFSAAPDFENPIDDDTDNDYEVQVTVTDSDGVTDVQDITVTVTNVSDALLMNSTSAYST